MHHPGGADPLLLQPHRRPARPQPDLLAQHPRPGQRRHQRGGPLEDPRGDRRVRVPRPKLCTDNGAMVAALGAELVARGRTPSALDLPADSSMPLTTVVA